MSNPVLIKSNQAGADLSAHALKAVRLSAGKLQLAVAGCAILGIAQKDKPVADAAGDVMLQGISRAIAGEAIAVGDQLAVGSSGKLVKATNGAIPVGMAYSAATADGSIFEVLLIPSVGAGAGKQLSLVVGAEAAVAANAIEIAGTITDAFGNAVTSAVNVKISSCAATANEGDIAAAGTPVGTLTFAVNPATGDNIALMATTAAGLFSFRITDTVAESCVVTVQAEGCAPQVLKLTFA
jgi:hypothetical protein